MFFSHLTRFFSNSQSRAIGLTFVLAGLLFGNWVPQIPYIKTKFGLDDGQLGLILLFMPFGATIANPLATVLLQKLGMRKLTLISIFIQPILFALPPLAPHLPIFCTCLFFVGAGYSILNIAINTCATTFEHQHKQHILSTCHGMWSMGGMLGSLCSSILIGGGMLPRTESLIVALLVILTVLYLTKFIRSLHEEKTEDESKSKFVMPNRILWGMIAISLCTNVTEGTMADWTAVYMRDVVQADAYFWGWGFAFYAALMATGRFVGDALIPILGTNKILIYGGIVSALGLLVAILFPTTWFAILGFALVGAGVSCGAPILYGSAARMPNMAKGAGLATMNTFSIAGFLAGPAIIGLISKYSSLPTALGFVAFLGLLWAVLSSKTRIY